jgi:hypothetical protein
MTRQSAALTQKQKIDAENINTRVRELNDFFRRDILNRDLGTLILTAGVAAFKDEIIATIIREVQTFEDFNEINDPHSEHESGAFEFSGMRYIWKIKYFLRGTKFCSPDKTDTEITHRVITIMRADEL